MIADIDIDVKTTFKIPFNDFVRASLIQDDNLKPHPCGYYPQKIAKDEVTGLSCIPYEKAEELGYFKIDFLHLSVYDNFINRKEILETLNEKPDWGLLLIPSVLSKMFQISNQEDLVIKLKPKSILEMADLLALMRPGKRHLTEEYIKNKNNIRKILFTKDEKSGYTFKKSHAIAYAQVIALQLILIEQSKI